MEEFVYFTTIKGIPEPYIEKIKGSKFISYIAPVTSKDKAFQYLNKIKKEHYNATHHCYGFKIGKESPYITQFSDDGEPSGTAGQPILSILEYGTITNIIVIVVRYYGGTKLGKGGLVKAYSNGAKGVINSSKIEKIEIKKDLKIEFDYNFTKTVYHFLSKFKGSINSENYSNKVIFDLSLNVAVFDKFMETLIEASDGKIKQL